MSCVDYLDAFVWIICIKPDVVLNHITLLSNDNVCCCGIEFQLFAEGYQMHFQQLLQPSIKEMDRAYNFCICESYIFARLNLCIDVPMHLHCLDVVCHAKLNGVTGNTVTPIHLA